VGSVVLSPGDVGAVPVARKVQTAGLLSGGGTLGGDLTLTLPAATPAEAAAGEVANKALTPASLATILAALAGKANAAGTISSAADRRRAAWRQSTIGLAAASAAEILAGTEAGKAVTPAGLAGLPRSLTPNGLWTFPAWLMWCRCAS
jgi:hypothetical protein